jgi:hypothetical protein
VVVQAGLQGTCVVAFVGQCVLAHSFSLYSHRDAPTKSETPDILSPKTTVLGDDALDPHFAGIKIVGVPRTLFDPIEEIGLRVGL